MTPTWVLSLVSLSILGVLLAGMRVSFGLALVGLTGLVWLMDPPQPQVAGKLLWNATNSYVLTAVPLFVLMAEIMVRSGLSERAFKTVLQWLGPLRGGAAYATVLGSAIFAAMSGSSVANAAALGAVAGKPLTDAGYSHRLTFGTIAAGGTLGILIPPSTALIIYGSLTGESVGHLFMAGVIPGIVATTLFFVTVAIWSFLRPSDAPRLPPVPLSERVASLLGLIPALALLLLVLGGIYDGFFSPSEAAGIGAFGALVIAGAHGALSLRVLTEALRSTVLVTSMIMLIIAGASIVTYVVGFLRLPATLTEYIVASGIPVGLILFFIALLFLVLGCFIETVSLIVLTVPVLHPVMTALDVSGMWLGVYVVILVEIGLITPPVGLNLFVLQSVPAGQTFRDIAVGATPYVVLLLLTVLLLVAFPEMATWLPEQMKGR